MTSSGSRNDEFGLPDAPRVAYHPCMDSSPPPRTASVPETRVPAARARLVVGLAGVAAFVVAVVAAAFHPGSAYWPSPDALRVAGLVCWMACFWLAEVVPLAATALLPVAVLPFFGVASVKALAPAYAHPVVLLFLGGFLLAAAFERWGLHRRVALVALSRAGAHPRRIVFAFMAATAFLSMWISNTATVLMLAPIALAVAGRIEPAAEGGRPFSKALLLGVAWAASIGGTVTPIGTPPNGVFLTMADRFVPGGAARFDFLSWLGLVLPIAAPLLLFAWWYLSRRVPARAAGAAQAWAALAEERRRLGPASREERLVGAVFLVVALLWLTRVGLPGLPGWAGWLGVEASVEDASVALLGAFVLFALPARSGNAGAARGRLLDWPTARGIPWGILLLFGGGLALAQAVETSGLSDAIGRALGGLAVGGPIVIVPAVCLAVTFLTEVTSNTATATILLPILAELARSAPEPFDPALLMLPAALSASCAFMLPVATPPNAIVYGSGRLTIGEMARAGLVLNLAGAAIISVAVLLRGV